MDDLRFDRLFHDIQDLPGGVEFNHAIPFRIFDPIAEHQAAPGQLHGPLQNPLEPMAIKNIVPQNEADPVPADEFLADDESLGQALGAGLFRIGKAQTQLSPVPQQALISGQVLRGGDEENVPDAGQHEDRQGIVDHGLVIDRQELFAHHLGNGIEPGPGSSRQNDSLPAGGGENPFWPDHFLRMVCLDHTLPHAEERILGGFLIIDCDMVNEDRDAGLTLAGPPACSHIT